MARIDTEIRTFSEAATYLVQPYDSFVISKIKDAQTGRWEEKKSPSSEKDVDKVMAGEEVVAC